MLAVELEIKTFSFLSKCSLEFQYPSIYNENMKPK